LTTDFLFFQQRIELRSAFGYRNRRASALRNLVNSGHSIARAIKNAASFFGVKKGAEITEAPG
jgi:hypothetical protein